MKSKKGNLKTRFLAGILALAMVFTMFGVIPEEVKASSGVTLNEGEIYKFADCEWMAVEVHDDYTTLVMTKGNTDHGVMSGYWPGYIKLCFDQSIEYEDISSYYSGLTYLYDQIRDKEYAAANGDGLYLVPSSLVSGKTKNYWTALKTAAENSGSFGAPYGVYAWLGTVNSLGCAWCVYLDGHIDYYIQDCGCVVAPAFNVDTSLLSASDIQSIFPESVTVNGKTAKLAKSSANIKKGKTTTIKVSPKFDKKNLKKITYTTSNKKIATVSKAGKVTGKKKGTATIKVKLYMQDGKTKTLNFKVKVK